ncbi:3',5'-cyclic-AMP phosphodiesterase 4C-like [Convolutriloba macropyga]|uniref:3',5'-cyclic-AMP phosphodiesterase 4C-like n=1 Tax=Convolutriloba macropyga TaxID=536237 RepID=UPI003F52136E
MSLTKTKKTEVELQLEKDKLQTTKEALEAQLQERDDLIRSKHRSLSMKSPMEKLVDLFDNLMEGGPLPDMQTLMNYRMIVATESDLRQPANLVGELLEEDMFEKDVGLSILQQLGYRLSKTQKSRSTSDASGQQSLASSSTGISDLAAAPVSPMDLESTGDPLLTLNPADQHTAFTQSSRDFSMSLGPAIRASRQTLAAKPSTSFEKLGPLHSRASMDYPSEKRSSSSDTFALSEMSPMPMASPSGHCVVPVLEQVLRKVHSWDFNVFQLNDVSHGNPLSALAFFLLKQSGLTRRFHLDEQALSLWLRSIEEQYQNNQYHNRIHAADVTHSMFAMITLGGLHQGLSRLQILAALLAAIVHDVDHPGNTNDFLVAADDELAIDYNDNSPLENHHLRTTFRLMRRPEYNFIAKLDTEQYRTLRSLVIDLVLATDMKRHFDILSQFQVGLSVRQNKEALSKAGDSPVARAAGCVRNLWERIPDNQMDDSQHALKLKVALKVADLGHLSAPGHVHREWVERLQEEFFCQGDREKSLNLPVSPLMDRTKPGITTAQLGFFEVVAMPLFESLATAYSNCRPLIQALQSNYDMWAKPEEPGVKLNKMRKRQNTV